MDVGKSPSSRRGYVGRARRITPDAVLLLRARERESCEFCRAEGEAAVSGRLRERRARRRARRALRAVKSPVPWTRESVLAAGSRICGRTLLVEKVEGMLTTEACGLLIELQDTALIVLGVGTPTWHQDAVVAHEVAHILLGHSGSLARSQANGLQEYFPDLDLAEVRRLLGRGSHTDSEEYEAEFLGTLILSRMTTGREISDRLRRAQKETGSRELWRAFGVERRA